MMIIRRMSASVYILVVDTFGSHSKLMSNSLMVTSLQDEGCLNLSLGLE